MLFGDYIAHKPTDLKFENKFHYHDLNLEYIICKNGSTGSKSYRKFFIFIFAAKIITEINYMNIILK